MSSHQHTADFIVEQLAQAGSIRARKMFGEYAVYCNDKVVALICDDQLFVKPTEAGISFVGECERAAPYPNAKPHILISGDRWDDADWLAELIRITAQTLPQPAARKAVHK